MHGPEIQWYVILSGILFATGALGVMIRRNPLIILLSVEIMLNSVVLALVTFAARAHTLPGVAMTFFVYVAASCEIAVAMAIVVLLVKRRGSLDLSRACELKG